MVRNLNNPEGPKEGTEETRRELNEYLKSIEWVDIWKDKTIQGKIMTESEKTVMRNYNILWSNGKVDLMDLAESLLDFNYNNSGDKTSRKNLWKNKHYIAATQVVLNLFNKKCEVSGNYDKATQTAVLELIQQRTNNPAFKLLPDGTVPSSAKNVIVNALLYPDGKNKKETTNKNEIGPTTRYAFYRTSYNADTWIIKTSGVEAWGMHVWKNYPKWTHWNSAFDGWLTSWYEDEEW